MQHCDQVPKSTHFEPWWLDHEECIAQIMDGWTVPDQAMPKGNLESLEGLKGEFLGWSKMVFGVIPKDINKIHQLILKLEEEGGNNSKLTNCRRKLQMMIEAEHGYWQQRSHSNWLQYRNRNTSYFHHHENHRHVRTK